MLEGGVGFYRRHEQKGNEPAQRLLDRTDFIVPAVAAILISRHGSNGFRLALQG